MGRSDCLAEEVRLISNKRLREFITSFLEDVVLDYFYTAPASSSGKYHPEYALGVGGLVRHTKAAVKIADDLLSLEQNEVLNELYHDEIISALIVHDTFKQGFNKGGHTKFEHPWFAAQALQLYAKENYDDLLPVAISIATMVCSHMGQWNTSTRSSLVLPKPYSDAEKFVHMCDYLASRKYLMVDVKYEPQTKEQATEET